jgi:hypothetical protein
MSYFYYLDGGDQAPNNFGYYGTNYNLYEVVYNPNGALYPALDLSIISNNGQYFFTGASVNNFYGQEYKNLHWQPGIYANPIYFGCRMYVGTMAQGTNFYFGNANGNPQINVYFTPSGGINVYSGGTISKQAGGGNTLLASTGNIIPAYSTFYFEIYLNVSSTNGSVVIRINGNPSPIISITGVNTASDSSSLPIIFFECASGNILYSNHLQPQIEPPYLRDFYFIDNTGSSPYNTFLGNFNAGFLTPQSNVSTSFSSTSANYQAAATVPANGGIYNYSSTVGTQDTFKFSTIPTNATVLNLSITDTSYKNDSGTRGLAKILTSGSTTVIGKNNYLTVGSYPHTDTYLTDPNTGVQWTPSGINSLILGYKVIG